MAETRAPSDQRLCERIEAGDVGALEELYDGYAGVVYRQALALLGSTADAEDVLQDVFLKLAGRRGAPIRDLKAYLCTAARHEAYSALRRRQRECAVGDEEGAVPFAGAWPGISARGEAIQDALRSLPAAQ